MLALSLRQPWAEAVLNGKGIENRGWLPTRGGPLPLRFLIHASKALTEPDYKQGAATIRLLGFLPPAREQLELGGLVGVTTVVDVIPAGASPQLARTIAAKYGVDARWWIPEFNAHGNCGWILQATERRPFVPYKGHQMFFAVPPATAAAFLAGQGAHP